MFVYFDANGTLKEIITEKTFRVGDSKRDKIYVYWDGEHSPISGWIKYRLANGQSTNETQFFGLGENDLIAKQLPTKPLRNLKYFSYDHTYEIDGEQHIGYLFYEITVPDEVLSYYGSDDERIPEENNIVVASIRFVMNEGIINYEEIDEDDTIEELGALVFSVEANAGILTDSSINLTQYNYLIGLLSEKIGVKTKSVKVDSLPAVGSGQTIYYKEVANADVYEV